MLRDDLTSIHVNYLSRLSNTTSIKNKEKHIFFTFCAIQKLSEIYPFLKHETFIPCGADVDSSRKKNVIFLGSKKEIFSVCVNRGNFEFSEFFRKGCENESLWVIPWLNGSRKSFEASQRQTLHQIFASIFMVKNK